MSFCTKGLPGVAESTDSKVKKPSPLRIGVRVMADEGCTESALPRPSPTVCNRPPVTEGLPGVAESTASKSEGKPSPWGEGASVRAVEGWRKRELPRPSSTVWYCPSSPGGRGLFLG